MGLWPPQAPPPAQDSSPTHALPPIIVFGASSGGRFAGAVAEVVATERQLNLDRGLTDVDSQSLFGRHGRLAGVVVQIMAIDPTVITPYWPPVAFIPMSRDRVTAAYITEDDRVLRLMGVPSKIFWVEPLSVDGPDFFQDRMNAPQPLANAMFDALHDGGFLEKQEGTEHWYLAMDPRRSDWRESMRQSPDQDLQFLPLLADASPLSEVLNVAWAQHELTAQFVAEALEWIASVVGS